MRWHVYSLVVFILPAGARTNRGGNFGSDGGLARYSSPIDDAARNASPGTTYCAAVLYLYSCDPKNAEALGDGLSNLVKHRYAACNCISSVCMSACKVATGLCRRLRVFSKNIPDDINQLVSRKI